MQIAELILQHPINAHFILSFFVYLIQLIMSARGKRHQYSFEEKTWWKELYKQSDFRGINGKRSFHNHVKLEIKNKAGELYDKFKKRNKDKYEIPPWDTFRNGFIRNNQ